LAIEEKLTVRAGNAIKDTTSFQKPRTLENLPEFLEKFAGEKEKLDQATKVFGAPHTIVVSAAGLRAADAVRYGFTLSTGFIKQSY
jgi:protein CMS1